MGRICRAHGRDENCTKFWLESLMGTDHLEDVGIDGRIMIKWILEK
jgi:hypothetical protein